MALLPSKKRRLILLKKNTDPVEGRSELAIVSAAAVSKAASSEQLRKANQYKNLAIEFMACNNVVGIKDILSALETWDPSLTALRTSGLPIIFHDIKFWEDARLSDRAAALRDKFRKVMKENGSSLKCNSLNPFHSLSHLQFRQAIDNMTALIRSGSTTVSESIHRKLAYHLVMHGFTVPQALEGLKVEACQCFASSMLDVTVLSQAIALGTAMAVAGRNILMVARTCEFKATLDSVQMVNAWSVTDHWNQLHLQANSCRLKQTFKDLGVDFTTMLPRKVAGQLALARCQGKDVLSACAERARHITLYRNQGSLASLRSGVRLWHKFAVFVLQYSEALSAPPRSFRDVLYWLGMFAHHGTAMNYVGYLKNFCEGENLSMRWLDNSVEAWRKGAAKLKLANGFKHTNKRVPFTWEWIKKLVSNFDRQRMARWFLFILVCWDFLLRPLSEACPMLVGGEQDIGSLPDNKHFGIWLDRQGRANLRLLKRKHRPRGSFMQRPHICGGFIQRASFCLACRLKITLAQTSYGEVLFPVKPSKIMQIIKANSLSLSYNPEGISWKSFRAGHATHLAACGCNINSLWRQET